MLYNISLIPSPLPVCVAVQVTEILMGANGKSKMGYIVEGTSSSPLQLTQDWCCSPQQHSESHSNGLQVATKRHMDRQHR